MADQEKIAQGVRLILEGIGEDLTREGLQETPERVARAYEELCSGMAQNPEDLFKKRFPAQYHDIVLVKDIPFCSLCEHHLLPFFGTASVAYIPSCEGSVCGISKLARLVDVYARRLQMQERLCSQIAHTLYDILDAQGVMVYMQAEHMCMTMRGVQKPGTKTHTCVALGSLAPGKDRYNEALRLVEGN